MLSCPLILTITQSSPLRLSGGVDYLVTGDKRHLLSLGKVEAVQIISARHFADLPGVSSAN